jgi:phosphotriesterase-related protein
VTDDERADLVVELVRAGHGAQVLLSSNAIGVAKGQPDDDLPYGHVLSAFVPLLRARGLGDDDVRRLLCENPGTLLSVATAGRR